MSGRPPSRPFRARRPGAPAARWAIRALAATALFWTSTAAGAQPEPTAATPQRGEQAEAAAAGPAGRVAFLVEPPDARIEVGHRIFRAANAPAAADAVEESRPNDAPGDGLALALAAGAPAAAAALPAGDHLAVVTRPGYLPTLAGFTVTEDEGVEVAVTLARRSAALRLRTAPSEATILIDGFVRGGTIGEAEPWFAPTGEAAAVPRTLFSGELWIEDLPAGVHDLEVRKRGFRTYRRELRIAEPRDYGLPPIVLGPEGATLLLKDLPDQARVFANGRELEPNRRKLMPEAPVEPGRVELVVTRGVHEYFEISLDVVDGSFHEVGVELRPALAYLGVFGEDAAGLRAVESAIEFLRAEGAHIVLDRAATGLAAFREFGIDASTLRDVPAAKAELDWRALQAKVQQAAPAALYVAAVLGDDLVAGAADLWLWSAAPGPSMPDVVTLEVQNGRLEAGALRRLVRALDPGLETGLPQPRLGAVLIESLEADGLLVAAVDAGSPAATAGMVPGMEIGRIDGEPASSGSTFTEALNGLAPGDTLELAVNGAEGETALTVEPEWGLSRLDVMAPGLMPSATAARLLREIDQPGDIPGWLLQLDLATLLIAAGDPDGAVRLLETIEAPERPGSGRAAIRYALGLALTDLGALGQAEARRNALRIFESLAANEGERFADEGGPRVAGRARLRASALDGQP